jgi:hypothetical protein
MEIEAMGAELISAAQKCEAMTAEVPARSLGYL